MKIVCISDTHNRKMRHPVPDGDILIHAGDATLNGTIEELRQFSDWFAVFPHQYKIFVAGNHDWLFQTDNARARRTLGSSIIYLQDEACEIEGLKIWGSPWQPWFMDWAFNLYRGPQLREKWALIPDDTNILITHGPPSRIQDLVPRGEYTGCEDLLVRVRALTRLKLHVFGHIHEGYGQIEKFGVQFVNAAICDGAYAAINKSIIVDIDREKV